MKRNLRFLPAARRARGLTLVELLVAIAIGMLITTAMAILFANNSRTRGETERASQKIENGRYAVELLASELHHAGYFGPFDPRKVTAPAAKPDPCITDVAAAEFQSAITLHVQGYDDVATNVLGCLSGSNAPKAGTDIVVVRRASGCVAGVGTCTALAAGAPGFQASSCNDSAANELSNTDVANHYELSTDTGAFTLRQRDCATTAGVLRYLVRIYYVAANDKSGDGVPTLKRAELGAGSFSVTSLVQGVENLQIEYGLDTNNDGNADVYTASPDLYLGCTTGTSPTCVGQWTSAVSAKLFVLTRNLETSAGHEDKKIYVLGQKADAVKGAGDLNKFGTFNDAYKRTVFQEVVRFQNASGRRLSP